ncbi:MAG: Ig-like domain-containing protein, partial [Cryobacterium sp.]|nr:Ig-like domain-containing protein [Cryobacterium sp.]
IDNTVSSVSMEDPGAFITGTATLNASASSSAGVTSVRIQRAPTGTPTWADVCTDTTSPYSCVWNSATVADGLYDFQAILVDGSGKVTTSAIVTARRVDNTPLRGTDIQAANGAATVGRMEPGDKITFTYSDLVNLNSITPAWTGAALPVTIRVQDGNVVGLGNADDTLSVERAGRTINLGTVNLKGDYVKSGKTVTFASTMTAATIMVNGVQVTAVTVTFGTATGGAARTSSTLANMVWTPSAAVRDLYGNANSAAPVTETGALDREF